MINVPFMTSTASLRYLNIVYLRGFRTIDLNNFKRSVLHISEAPPSGDELRSAIGFFSFLLNFVPNLRFYLKHLNTLASKYPAKKLISWLNTQTWKKPIFISVKLCRVTRPFTHFQTIFIKFTNMYWTSTLVMLRLVI